MDVDLRRERMPDGCVATLVFDPEQRRLTIRFADDNAPEPMTWYSHRALDFDFASVDEFLASGATFFGVDTDLDGLESSVVLFGAVGEAVSSETMDLLREQCGLVRSDIDDRGFVLRAVRSP